MPGACSMAAWGQTARTMQVGVSVKKIACPAPVRAHASKSPVSRRDGKRQSGRHVGCVYLRILLLCVPSSKAQTRGVLLRGLERKAKTELVPIQYSAGSCQRERAEISTVPSCYVLIVMAADPGSNLLSDMMNRVTRLDYFVCHSSYRTARSHQLSHIVHPPAFTSLRFCLSLPLARNASPPNTSGSWGDKKIQKKSIAVKDTLAVNNCGKPLDNDLLQFREDKPPGQQTHYLNCVPAFLCHIDRIQTSLSVYLKSVPC